MSEGIEYEYPSGATKGRTRAEAKNTQIGRELIREINILFSYGVPLVLSSGNEGEQEGRQVIDHMPQVSEAEDFPLTNVEAATLDGKAAHDSVSNNQAPDPSSPIQKRTFVVGLEQTASPDCETYTPWGVNQLPSTVCKALPTYENRYFFYRLDDNAQEVDSLYTSLLNDFHQDD
jgi:hypothetical protein